MNRNLKLILGFLAGFIAIFVYAWIGGLELVQGPELAEALRHSLVGGFVVALWTYMIF